MNHTTIRLESDSNGNQPRFRTGVSLHSHTLCSKESLDFIYKFVTKSALLRFAVRRGEMQYRKVHGTELDFSRGWWTPPLAPHNAWMLERDHIQTKLEANALVSITDHDNIDAPLTLRVLDECQDAPISVEWTVPYRGTFFHLGVHNLPLENAREWMARLEECTAHPEEEKITAILNDIAARPAALIVFNHPCWDESNIGQDRHCALAAEFSRTHLGTIHAFEVNGLRPWKENRSNIEMARSFGKPAISGGDRHALEANTTLNMSNAATFAEFAAEVRDGYSNLFITKQYMEPFTLRVLASIEDILRDHENHGRGWRRWSDRVFYICDDGVTRSATELFQNRVPGAVQVFVHSIEMIRRGALRHAFRATMARNEEVAL